LKKDIVFNARVVSAEFNEDTSKWTVRCDNGKVFRASFFIAAIGFAAKRHFPEWKGLDSFKGIIHHSSFWPKDVDVRGKKMAVIGTGATGVQVSLCSEVNAFNVLADLIGRLPKSVLKKPVNLLCSCEHQT
jgi:cation diffusion facilitator CzcD-associated flavoprotein CzcO